MSTPTMWSIQGHGQFFQVGFVEITYLTKSGRTTLRPVWNGKGGILRTRGLNNSYLLDLFTFWITEHFTCKSKWRVIDGQTLWSYYLRMWSLSSLYKYLHQGGTNCLSCPVPIEGRRKLVFLCLALSKYASRFLYGPIKPVHTMKLSFVTI